MSVVSNRRMRLHALAAATAVAVSAIAAPAFAGKVNLSGLEAGIQYDRFIVKYRDGSAEGADVGKAKAALGRATKAGVAGKALAVGHLRRMSLGADVVKANRKLDRVEAQLLMQQLANASNVEYVELDKFNTIKLTPNDTRYSEQWGYSGTYGIKADQAWDVTNGTGVVVAVLDTGITNHSDLNANILPGYDFIGDTDVSVDGDGRDADASDPGDWYDNAHCGPAPAPPSSNSSWHGTHVAGTIAAVTNNAKGVAGVAHGAKIVPARVLGRCGGYDSDIADAMIWASGGTVTGVPANANPAEVINLSLGGSGACGTTTQNAINSAVSRGTTLVIAAGNDNTNVSNASPANCNNVIAVASITSTGARSSFSNYGSLIDIAAPGSNILSTLNSGATTPSTETYASYNGTS
ncbi:MAG TPA: S8 family peptidase, partial [Lysobacter sp.]|nr:S8 family peptidase [Lysobacter sp.]